MSTRQERPVARTEAHGGLTAGRVKLPVDEAEQWCRELFGITGSADRMTTEKDDTFRIDTGDRRFVLKVSNPAEPAEEIAFQVALIDHVGLADPTLPVPKVVPTLAGQRLARIDDRAGQAHDVRLMSWVEGSPLDRMVLSPALRRDIGRVLGRLRLATAGFSHPADGRVLAWDIRHLLNLRPLLEHIGDPHHRGLVEAGLDRFAEVEPQLRAMPVQVLHNDFSLSNLVADEATPDVLAGVIDFGDSVRTAVAVDVSTALLNQLPRSVARGDDIFADGRDVMAGYLSVASLTDQELALVPHLVMGRAVARALLTSGRARMFPDNAEYILRNTEPGWGQLEWFLHRSPSDVSRQLEAA